MIEKYSWRNEEYVKQMVVTGLCKTPEEANKFLDEHDGAVDKLVDICKFMGLEYGCAVKKDGEWIPYHSSINDIFQAKKFVKLGMADSIEEYADFMDKNKETIKKTVELTKKMLYGSDMITEFPENGDSDDKKR